MYCSFCYELVWAGRIDLFTIGYCLSFRRSGRHLLLIEPFIKAFYRNDFGSIMCRGEWSDASEVLVNTFRIHKVPVQPWMTLHFVDLVAAEVLITEVSVPLPINGFFRGF